MDYVIDIQCCLDNKDKIVPKEVAILSLKGDHMAHYIIIPPYNANKLSDKARNQNNWLAKNKHGISWHDGFISKKSLVENLQELSRRAGCVYVRGREKSSILQELMSCVIINLEDDEKCPSFQNLPASNKYCIFHSLKFCPLKYTCALNNAARLKDWISQEDYISKQKQEKKETQLQQQHTQDLEYEFRLPDAVTAIINDEQFGDIAAYFENQES